MQDNQEKALILCAGSGVGGMERLIRNLAAELSVQSCRATVILPISDEATQTQQWLHRSGVESRVSGSVIHSFGRRRLHQVPRLVNLLRASDASVVNLHYGITYPPLNDVLAVRLSGKRCVVSLHSGGGADPPQRRSRIRKNCLASRFCDSFVAVSRFQAEMLAREGIPRHKITVIPCGLEASPPGLSKSAARRTLDLPPDAVIVACASRLTVQKGVHHLIDALGKLRADGIGQRAPVFLAVAGDGGERAALEQRARAALGGCFRFFGFLNDVNRLYAAADLFCLPSYEESFGQVYAEAAFHRLPSVGSNVGGVPENVLEGVTGLLTAPGDVGALATALGALIDDPRLRVQMGEAAYVRACAEFRIDRMATSYRRILFPALGVPALGDLCAESGQI